MYNVKGSSSHGGNNNSKPFPVFGEVAVGTIEALEEIWGLKWAL